MHGIDRPRTLESINKLSCFLYENRHNIPISQLFEKMNKKFKIILRESKEIPKQLLLKQNNIWNNNNEIYNDILDYLKILLTYGCEKINTNQNDLMHTKNLIKNDIVCLYQTRWFYNGKETITYGRFEDYIFFCFFDEVFSIYNIKLINFDIDYFKYI